jgi:hypothetical protein
MKFHKTMKAICYAVGVIAVLIGTGCCLIAVWTEGLNEILWRIVLSTIVVFGGACGILIVGSFLGPKKKEGDVTVGEVRKP